MCRKVSAGYHYQFIEKVACYVVENFVIGNRAESEMSLVLPDHARLTRTHSKVSSCSMSMSVVMYYSLPTIEIGSTGTETGIPPTAIWFYTTLAVTSGSTYEHGSKHESKTSSEHFRVKHFHIFFPI